MDPVTRLLHLEDLVPGVHARHSQAPDDKRTGGPQLFLDCDLGWRGVDPEPVRRRR